MSVDNKNMPSAPPPYVEHPQGQHSPYGFTANVGQTHPQGPTGYNPYQPGYPPAQPGYPPGQPGYGPGQGYAPSQPGYPAAQPGYPGVQTVQSVTSPGRPQTITMQPQGGQTVVVNVGGCPTCRVGVLEDSYTCLGVCCAIVFFPVGILCCLAMKEKRCVNCNSTF